MRNVLLIVALILLLMSGTSLRVSKTTIIGKVNPADGADMVWVLNEKDSLKSGVSEGQFYFDVKPGAYKLVVDAKQPYKDVLLDNLVVKLDETLDVGEIILKQ